MICFLLSSCFRKELNINCNENGAVLDPSRFSEGDERIGFDSKKGCLNNRK